MRILILEDDSQELAAIESAIRNRTVDDRGADALGTIQRLYQFAGWSLDAMTRDLVSPAGRPVNLTSSEFDLLVTFLRCPGEPLSRATLVGALKGREWNYFDRSIDTLVARLRKKLTEDSNRAPLVRSVRGVGYVLCAAVSRSVARGQTVAA
jgi:two-component system, OmpR family, response regulator